MKSSTKQEHLRPLSKSVPKATYATPFMQVYHCRADFGSFAKDYYVIGFKQRGGIVVLRDKRVLLVRQYRLLIDDYSWELPGGSIEATETLEDGLRRECFEETGVRPGNLTRLLVYYPGLDNVDNRTSLYYSEEAEVAGPFVSNPAEVMEIAWVPLERCLEMIFDEEILDAMTVAGLLAYDHVERRAGLSRC